MILVSQLDQRGVIEMTVSDPLRLRHLEELFLMLTAMPHLKSKNRVGQLWKSKCWSQKVCIVVILTNRKNNAVFLRVRPTAFNLDVSFTRLIMDIWTPLTTYLQNVEIYLPRCKMHTNCYWRRLQGQELTLRDSSMKDYDHRDFSQTSLFKSIFFWRTWQSRINPKRRLSSGRKEMDFCSTIVHKVLIRSLSPPLLEN